MKYFLSDVAKLSVVLYLWWVLLNYLYDHQLFQYYEAIKYFPLHLIITIGYFAVLSICYKILLIKDCVKEHAELVTEINEGRVYFNKNQIKFN